MLTIEYALKSDRSLRQLIHCHASYCAAHTPKGSGHAIPGIERPSEEGKGTEFWVAWLGDVAVGCIGFRRLDDYAGEIKTLHVLAEYRGKGFAEHLLRTVIDEAKSHDMDVLLLETGSSEGFAASRSLYAKTGFQPCEKYGSYASDPFSYCMKLNLSSVG